MTSIPRHVSRRAILGAATAFGAALTLGLPVQAAGKRNPYGLETWQPLAGRQVLVNGNSTHVRKVTQGIGSAFHVVADGAGLEEKLLAVTHPSFGTVELFACVQDDTAIFTFNSTKEQ